MWLVATLLGTTALSFQKVPPLSTSSRRLWSEAVQQGPHLPILRFPRAPSSPGVVHGLGSEVTLTLLDLQGPSRENVSSSRVRLPGKSCWGTGALGSGHSLALPSPTVRHRHTFSGLGGGQGDLEDPSKGWSWVALD